MEGYHDICRLQDFALQGEADRTGLVHLGEKQVTGSPQVGPGGKLLRSQALNSCMYSCEPWEAGRQSAQDERLQRALQSGYDTDKKKD